MALDQTRVDSTKPGEASPKAGEAIKDILTIMIIILMVLLGTVGFVIHLVFLFVLAVRPEMTSSMTTTNWVVNAVVLCIEWFCCATLLYMYENTKRRKITR